MDIIRPRKKRRGNKLVLTVNNEAGYRKKA